MKGYLGNNSRVVVAPGHLNVQSSREDFQNAVRGIGKKLSDNEMEFKTPSRGKRVIVNIDCPEYSDYQIGDQIAFLGEKYQDHLRLTNHQKLRVSISDYFDVDDGYCEAY